MRRFSRWIMLLVIVLIALSVWAIYPPGEKINLGLDLKGGMHLVLEADTRRLPPGESVKDAVDTALEVIRNRIDQFGVREPTIARQGLTRIVVDLPGIEDPQRAIELIGKTALLEFKLLDEKGDLNKALEGDIPAGDEILYDSEGKAYLVKKEALLTGSAIKDARVEINQWGQPYVALDFTKEGAEKFADITGKHVGERLAIILDNVVKSAPVIKTRITGGKAVIEGNFTMEEANELRIVLKSGALPIPLNIIQNTTVGPSLGKDSIRKGLLSGIIGLIAVLIFMGVYYKKAGLIADLALILNLLFLMASLAALKATLTLPGIAGIILTIGMSIDANVIIFERIREELKKERAPRSAVDVGYDRALRTILDANITTLITALILFQFGTGPVKGFATTLSIGILASLFTAVVVTRAIFNLLLEERPVQRLSI
ncbi:MAG TPA: protein translocase subunit SecD [Candidatus Aerophobetes bacterium]|uniref:Protein translocase subunit SecD n=1 Tax=Aerophobetes bacterium TaxID=2030807 RepID=A0A7V5HXV0_UNCAE|nr:protein translocase subunit SecD [Candidatus Aerophobetes bacterium]